MVRGVSTNTGVCVLGAAALLSACTENSGWVQPDAMPPPAWDAAPYYSPPPPVAPPSPPPPNPCVAVFCSGRGVCEVFGSQAQCRCEPGFLAEGPTCEEDRDTDGISEAREYQLALEYAPVLRFSDDELYDERTPYWTATRIADGTTVIFYALSYYEDGGATEWAFNPHLGDAEFIVAQLQAFGPPRYFLSAHYGTLFDSSAWVTLDGFELDRRFPGTHPIVYVAVGKHANYASAAACDNGSFGFDKCDHGRDEIVLVERERNLGQSWLPFLDGVAQYGDRGQAREWYWTDVAFCGWRVPSDRSEDRTQCVPPANSYARQLRDWFM